MVYICWAFYQQKHSRYKFFEKPCFGNKKWGGAKKFYALQPSTRCLATRYRLLSEMYHEWFVICGYILLLPWAAPMKHATRTLTWCWSLPPSQDNVLFYPCHQDSWFFPFACISLNCPRTARVSGRQISPTCESPRAAPSQNVTAGLCGERGALGEGTS